MGPPQVIAGEPLAISGQDFYMLDLFVMRNKQSVLGR